MLSPRVKENWKWSNKMASVNISNLGVSALKWTRMGKFNSDDYYNYPCGQESFRGNGEVLIVNKRV